jgi:hypothetical protein
MITFLHIILYLLIAAAIGVSVIVFACLLTSKNIEKELREDDFYGDDDYYN